MEANETVEVDLRVNTAEVHMEQQKPLLRQTSSNPCWFLFNQDVLALKDAKGNKIYSDYEDARARGLERHASPPTSFSWRCWSSEVVAAPLQRLQCALTLLFACV